MFEFCGYLSEIIENNFKFLFQENRYETVHTQKGKVSGCVVILEGEQLRIRFQTTRDEDLNILVGDLAAPLGWTEEVEGKRTWYYLAEIVGFITNDAAIGERVARMTRDEINEMRTNVASELSTKLRNNLDTIEQLFADGLFFRRQDDYDRYVSEASKRTRTAYERIARGIDQHLDRDG